MVFFDAQSQLPHSHTKKRFDALLTSNDWLLGGGFWKSSSQALLQARFELKALELSCVRARYVDSSNEVNFFR